MRVVNLRAVVLCLLGLLAMAICPGQGWFGVPAIAFAQDDPFESPAEGAAYEDPFGSADTSEELSKPPRGAITRRTPNASHDEPSHVSKDKAVSESAHPNAPGTATEAKKKIRAMLSSICNFDYIEMPFLEVKEALESKWGVNIVLTSSATDDALTEDEIISTTLSGISNANALRIILAEKNATFCVLDDAIQLISLDEAFDERWFTRQMIDVSETLKIIRVAESDRIGKPIHGLIRIDDPAQRGGGGGVFAFDSGEPTSRRSADETSEIKQLADAILQAVKNTQPKFRQTVKLVSAESILIDAIQETVTESNEINITCVGGVLIVNGPEQVNEQVASFVDELTSIMKTAAANR